MKKVLIITVLCLIGAYIIFAAFYFQDKPKEGLCTDIEVVLDNDNGDFFVNPEDVKKALTTEKLNPVGKHIKEINTYDIEEAVLKNQLIRQADVFITNNNAIKVVIQERTPILRVKTNSGENYYIDKEGYKMPTSIYTTAYLPLATGAIKEDFAKVDLYKFALFLYDDRFWNAQIEQIVVLANNDIVLIPRIGDHEIVLGEIEGYKEKLDKLLIFYREGLNKSGWNKYSVINLKYDKQVVCTKR